MNVSCWNCVKYRLLDIYGFGMSIEFTFLLPLVSSK